MGTSGRMGSFGGAFVPGVLLVVIGAGGWKGVAILF